MQPQDSAAQRIFSMDEPFVARAIRAGASSEELYTARITRVYIVCLSR